MTVVRNKDITIKQNTTFSRGWIVRYRGNLIDPTWTAEAQLRATVESENVLANFTTTVNSDGSVVIGLSAEQSRNWKWSSAYYGVMITDPNGVRLLVREGRAFLEKSVVR